MSKPIAPDLEFSGHGVYTLWANTRDGLDFILENVGWEEWQGSPEHGIAVDGANMAQAITDGAFEAGLHVAVNGRKYIGNGCVA
jgi:hypothetical protein